jgi:hypothetical protein
VVAAAGAPVPAGLAVDVALDEPQPAKAMATTAKGTRPRVDSMLWESPVADWYRPSRRDPCRVCSTGRQSRGGLRPSPLVSCDAVTWAPRSKGEAMGRRLHGLGRLVGNIIGASVPGFYPEAVRGVPLPEPENPPAFVRPADQTGAGAPRPTTKPRLKQS